MTAEDRLSARLRVLAELMLAPELGPASHRTLVTINRFLLPRLTDGQLPLVVALVGSTGTGKSTLFNSLAGGSHSPAGPLRPTTKRPVVVAPAGHVPALAQVLEAETAREGGGPLDGIALVDTPDLDSDLAHHRQMAMDTVESADAAVWVTTPARYADRAPWRALERMTTRRMPRVVVLNRESSHSSGALPDLRARLRHLPSPPSVLTIAEQRLDPDTECLPAASLGGLVATVNEWSGSDSLRAELMIATLAEVWSTARRLANSLAGDSVRGESQAATRSRRGFFGRRRQQAVVSSLATDILRTAEEIDRLAEEWHAR